MWFIQLVWFKHDHVKNDIDFTKFQDNIISLNQIDFTKLKFPFFLNIKMIMFWIDMSQLELTWKIYDQGYELH
jgi:hypothetical protein